MMAPVCIEYIIYKYHANMQQIMCDIIRLYMNNNLIGIDRASVFMTQTCVFPDFKPVV